MTLVHLLWLCVILLKITQTQAVLKNFEVSGKVYVVDDSETGPQSDAVAKCNEINAKLPSLKDSTKFQNVIDEMSMPRTKLDTKRMYFWIVDDNQEGQNYGMSGAYCDALQNFEMLIGFDKLGNPYPPDTWYSNGSTWSRVPRLCTHTQWSYTLCMCIEGLNNDETACKPTCDCSDDATCSDGVCTCNEGFEGDGKTCTSSRPAEYLGDPDMYVIVNQGVKYSDASKRCFENYQAELAAFTQDQYKSFMDRLMMSNNLDETKQYWIGLKRTKADSNGNKQFVWPDGKTYTPNVQSWPSTKFSYASSEDCVRMHYYENEWIWNDALCGKKYFFICMKVDFIIGRYHYKLVAPQKLEQSPAETACEDKFQGELVSFSTEAQYNAFLLAAPLNKDRQYWLGLKRHGSRGNYVWKLKSGEIHDMDEWPTVFNSDNSKEKCMRLLFYKNEWTWADVPCTNYKFNYICVQDTSEGAYDSEPGAQTAGAGSHHLCGLLMLCTLIWCFIAI